MSDNGHTDGRLTTTEFWSGWWDSISLPSRIDLRTDYTRACFDAVFRMVLTPGKKRFLEIGSGACEWLAYFEHAFGYESYGIDYSLRGCMVGRRNLQLQHVPQRVVCADLHQPPFPRGSFDVVFSGGVIEHFDNVHRPLYAIASLVAPGGWLVTIVPNMAGWVGAWRRVTDVTIYQMHNVLSAADLHEAHTSLGLENVRAGYFGSLRVPDFLAAHRRSPWPQKRLAWAASRAVDRTLTGLYRRTGKGLDSSRLSSYVYAVGRRPS